MMLPEWDLILGEKNNNYVFPCSLMTHKTVCTPGSTVRGLDKRGNVLGYDIMGVSQAQIRLVPPSATGLVSPTGECRGAG